MNKGVVLVASAYMFWGIHPIYWNLLDDLSAVEIFGYRTIFSFIFVAERKIHSLLR